MFIVISKQSKGKKKCLKIKIKSEKIIPEYLDKQALFIENDLKKLVKDSKERKLKRKEFQKLENVNERNRKLLEVNKEQFEDELSIDELIENYFLKENINNENNKAYKRKLTINNLPEFKYIYIEKHMDRKEIKCPICLEEFNSFDRVKLFSCKQHIFHKQCIMKWLDDKDFCPLCKKTIKY